MTDIRNFITIARQRGVIDEVTEQRLQELNDELASGTVKSDHLFPELEKPVDEVSGRAFEDREAPRFIRGFHDILITIGIVVALGGLWALSHAILVIVAIVGLAEFFVRRQRLALPAFTLTLALLTAVSALFSGNLSNDSNAGMIVFGAQLVALAAFYWRYRIPVALAGLIWSGFGLAFFVLLAIFAGGKSPEIFVEANPRLVGLIGLLLTTGMFVGCDAL